MSTLGMLPAMVSPTNSDAHTRTVDEKIQLVSFNQTM
jgi:hypothetical protein